MLGHRLVIKAQIIPNKFGGKSETTRLYQFQIALFLEERMWMRALDLVTPTSKWPGWSWLEKPTKDVKAALAQDRRQCGLAFGVSINGACEPWLKYWREQLWGSCQEGTDGVGAHPELSNWLSQVSLSLLVLASSLPTGGWL